METYYIYKICCKNVDVTGCYVGSSKDIKQRINKHKSMCNNQNSPRYNLKIYQTIRANGGWENYKLIVLEEMINTTTSEATIREEEVRVELNASLNMVRASTGFGYIGLTILESNRERIKIWREQNKEKSIEYRKEYDILNKEKIKEHNRLYYKQNSEKRIEYQKEYDILHAEKIKERKRLWYQINKEKKKQYNILRYQKMKATKFIENTNDMIA